MLYCRNICRRILPLLWAVVLVFAMMGCSKPSVQPQPTATAEPQELKLTFVNVGHGDCIVIQIQGRTLVVDTGKEEDFPEIARYLMDQKIETIDTVFITHSHKDHIGGLRNLAKTFSIKHVIIGSAAIDYNGVFEKVGAPVRAVEVGDVLTFGGLSLEVLHPERGASYQKENDRSLTMRGEFQDFSFMLTGDIENVSQKDIVEAEVLKPVTVMKVPNHGDIDAFYAPFYMETRPQFAVFTCEEEEPPAARMIGEHVPTQIPLASTGTYQMIYKDGELTHSAYTYPVPEGESPRVAVIHVDAKKEEVVLENQSGKAVSLYGWHLQSSRGLEIYYFTEDVTLEAGQRLSIVSGKDMPEGDIRWSEKNIINKKNDIITLYDTHNRPISMKQPD